MVENDTPEKPADDASQADPIAEEIAKVEPIERLLGITPIEDTVRLAWEKDHPVETPPEPTKPEDKTPEAGTDEPPADEKKADGEATTPETPAEEAEPEKSAEPEETPDEKQYAGEFDTPEELEASHTEQQEIIELQGQYLDKFFIEEKGSLRLRPEAAAFLQQADEGVGLEAPEFKLDADDNTKALAEELDDQFGSGASETFAKLVNQVLTQRQGAFQAQAEEQEETDAAANENDRQAEALDTAIKEFQVKYKGQFEKYEDDIREHYDRYVKFYGEKQGALRAREAILSGVQSIEDVFLQIKTRKELPKLMKNVRDAVIKELSERGAVPSMEKPGSAPGASSPPSDDYASQVVNAGPKTKFDTWLHGRSTGG